MVPTGEEKRIAPKKIALTHEGRRAQIGECLRGAGVTDDQIITEVYSKRVHEEAVDFAWAEATQTERERIILEVRPKLRRVADSAGNEYRIRDKDLEEILDPRLEDILTDPGAGGAGDVVVFFYHLSTRIVLHFKKGTPTVMCQDKIKVGDLVEFRWREQKNKATQSCARHRLSCSSGPRRSLDDS